MVQKQVLAGRRALWPVMALGLVLSGLVLARQDWASRLGVDDFVAYWAAGRLNLAGSNPYDPASLLALQRPVGWALDRADMIWTPPWALPLMMPFGVPAYPVGRLLWLLLSLGIILLCTDLAWRLYGGPRSRRWWALAVVATFTPALFALRMGQISPLILLGMVGFLALEQRQRWWLAGAVAALAAIKPQLLYLFWIALLLWVVQTRRWPVLGGVAVALLAGTALALAANPAVLGHYVVSARANPPDYWATPTVGSLLRLAWGPEHFWLQFVPVGLGLLWLALYWRRHRRDWRWPDQLPVLLLASLATTAYGWEYDQVVLLVPVIQVFTWLALGGPRRVTAAVAGSYLAINGLALLVNLAQLGAFWFFWMPAAFLIWYGAAHRLVGRQAHA